MSQQEQDNPKKDLPNNDLENSNAAAAGRGGNVKPEENERKENTAERAFSNPATGQDSGDKEEDRLEKAMLEENESSGLRAQSEEKEKEYSNAQKEDSDKKEEPSGNKDQAGETAADKNIKKQESDTDTALEKMRSEKPETETNENKEEASGKEKKISEEEALEKMRSERSTVEEVNKDLSKVEEASEEKKTENPAAPQASDAEEEDDEDHKTSEDKKNAQSEFEDSVAGDSEDETATERHGIEKKDYHSMSKEELVAELERLVKNEKVQAIKEHVEEIRAEFNAKFDEELEEKKEEFLADGGNIIDFHYSTPLKKQFNNAYFDYKEKRNNYYKQLKQDLNKNLARRLEIIEELKGLLGVEENINTTYKHFKELQDSWRTAGPIPRDKYNTVWNTYHHHVENFYDFLHLNREFRDMDFKHNLEQKLKVIDRAEELTQEKDTGRAFRELQMLHKMWKEELGPVAKEYREDIWNRFSEATKKIHDLRQAYYDQLDQQFEKNLEVKQEINEKIKTLAETEYTSHNQWQQKIKELEALREEFFKAGKVPRSKNEETWAEFKKNVRQFNRNKNAYYKSLKKDQYENLEKKKELIKIAEDNKDNDDFKATTPLMKKIQADWKKIGHVPRKDSDKVWKQFKAACNHYFDRLHKNNNQENSEELQAFEKKKEILDNVKGLEMTGNKKEDLPKIKAAIEEWKNIGKVPYNKRFIEGKFNKLLDQLFSKLDVDNTKAEMMKYENKLQAINDADDDKQLRNEHYFLSKKIEETKAEIRQLENNLQFFSNVDDDNPLVKDVHKNIAEHKEQLKIWQEKLEKIKSLY
ncbi:DUF349 domain-containing protein [Antarcticibacterium flavum]|uniref:DUF349 domain-containing protein n=1 Tax=Antarcticibacterium flavum TaxID=2058175 RepID=A0A5B7X6E2_9FLAO|nr:MULTISPECIES: DUF349 domain-containing protein [Antarcticibacterium]MCM4159347.1 DUF349 domain-containing protein [Antarcticibacterium sp. W02-3]QCY70949.1 DUF349 domain-containing protein [Antarcticibacterium flavum]